jgi:hypothetical protein
MDHSEYDPYQDLSRPVNSRGQRQKSAHFRVTEQTEELLDSHDGEGFQKRPRPGITTRTEAAEFQQIRWPDGPRFLVTSILMDTMTFVLEGILVMIALAFFCLAFLACRWSDMPADSDTARGMEQAMKLVWDPVL